MTLPMTEVVDEMDELEEKADDGGGGGEAAAIPPAPVPPAPPPPCPPLPLLLESEAASGSSIKSSGSSRAAAAGGRPERGPIWSPASSETRAEDADVPPLARFRALTPWAPDVPRRQALLRREAADVEVE